MEWENVLIQLKQMVSILVEKIKTDYADDVAIMSVYGSYIHNATHEKSDIDFYFIPKSEKGFSLARTFIVEGTGFDFWALSWERAENIANYNGGFASIIADAEVVWHASREDLERYLELQDRARNPVFDRAGKVNERLIEIEHQYFEIYALKGNFSLQKQKAVRLLGQLIEILALLNHTYIHRGWSSSLEEACTLKKLPREFKETSEHILFAREANDLIPNLFRLIVATKRLADSRESYTTDYKNAFAMLYEEEKSIYNKLYRACDTGDAATAVMAGVAIQEDIINIMGFSAYQQYFSDIVSPFDVNNLPGYKGFVQKHEQQFLNFIRVNGIAITEYSSIDEFAKAIRATG